MSPFWHNIDLGDRTSTSFSTIDDGPENENDGTP